MPTRYQSLGPYAGLAPELKDTLRRNGMQARLLHEEGGVRLAVQGHDSPLLSYPLTRAQITALTDGGTNSSNRKAYDTFASIVGGDFHMPKDYVHARNANGRVVTGLHGYRAGIGDVARADHPYSDQWAYRGLLGWTPRAQDGFHLRRVGGELRYAGAPLVPERPDGRMRPGELQSGGYGFYYKGDQPGRTGQQVRAAQQLDPLDDLKVIVPEIQPRPRNAEAAKPYSEVITSDVYFSQDKWNEVLASHGIVIDAEAKTLTVKSSAINRDLVYDLRDDELQALTEPSLKEVPVSTRIDILNGVIAKDYDGKITFDMLEGRETIALALSPDAIRDIQEQERFLCGQLSPSEAFVLSTRENALLRDESYLLRGTAQVDGRTLVDMGTRQDWFREGAHGRQVDVGGIWIEPVLGKDEDPARDMKYRMTAVINGEEISHEITRRQYDKFMAVDDYHRMKLFSKVFNEVDMKDLPREQEFHLGPALFAALQVAGELVRGPRIAPDLYMERHAGGHIYMKPGVDTAQDIASRAFDAGINAAEHGVGLGR